MRLGQRLRTRLEQLAQVVSIKPRAPPTWVYNLEVQGEHVYEVGPNGILVHNGCGGGSTVRVYRVEGDPNTRILIGKNGEVTIVEEDKVLWLNFGSEERAREFLAKRMAQKMPGVTVKSFEVPRSFLDELRATAVRRKSVRQYPDKPILTDDSRAPDQFGLRPEHIEKLKKVIIQGSGKIGF